MIDLSHEELRRTMRLLLDGICLFVFLSVGIAWVCLG